MTGQLPGTIAGVQAVTSIDSFVGQRGEIRKQCGGKDGLE
jgi:hypothetical protein